ncbi:MAG: hypothetical protein N4A35_01360 [Flavobacteriales bacterium]|jgi:hypothetical protein|nr:hypothetical protein [Flavobacteriales bacterium]
MKVWFEYEYGYVNIDTHYLYLTRSGNWSETTKLKELSTHKKSKNIKGLSVIVILPIIGFLLFGGILYQLNSNRISLTLLIGSSLLLFFLYQYMKSEIGDRYKINLTKIVEIQFEDKNCRIHFYDADNEMKETELVNISDKGYETLKKLKSYL